VAEPRIDVSIEHKHRPEENSDGARKHPNTCPSCGSHYRDDELEANLRVCPQCGHHFPVRARDRIAQLVDPGTFQEEAVELRSEDPLAFFDLRPYTERLAEAEVSTGLGDAMVIGGAAIESEPCELAVMDFAFMGGSMGSVVGEKMTRAADSAIERRVPLVTVTSGIPTSAAESQARESFSPTTLPIEPPMKEKSMTASTHVSPSIAALPITIASPRPVEISASASRSV